MSNSNMIKQATSETPKTSINNEVIALHCSGGNGAQWRALKSSLGLQAIVHTPEHFGTTSDAEWSDKEPASLAAEARKSLRLIDQSDRTIHLVGHSYGGALALHIALARPERIASLSLYEPCAFHLLSQLGKAGAAASDEINAIAAHVRKQNRLGDYEKAMADFVDYWNGDGAWESIQSEHRVYLKAWSPNANIAFDALFNEETKLDEYAKLNVPVYLLQGQTSPLSAQAVSETLTEVLPNCQQQTLAGMGHMGPLTHQAKVAALISQHINENTADTQQSVRGSNLKQTLVKAA